MATLEVVVFPDKRLREVSKPVEVIDDELVKLVNDMAETMYLNDGIGLAAIQVGVPIRLFICDIAPTDEQGQELMVFINPEIIERSGKLSGSEGCLSVPGLREEVKRSQYIVMKAINLEGEEFEVEASDLMAVCLQHELDHLNGVVFLDHLSAITRKFALIKYKKYLKELDE